MTNELAEQKRSQAKPWAIAVALLLLGVGGIIFYFLENEAAFPVATINLKISKDEVWQRVDDWANKVGYPTEQNIRSLIFNSDDQSLAFLQHTMGSNQAKKISQGEVPVWYWSARSCKEHNQELLEIDLSPSGQLVRLEHQIPNDKKLPNLSREGAQALAMQFIDKDSGLATRDYKLIETHENSMVNRVDHTFVWESTNRDYAGAKPRISVAITGNTVNEFHYYMYLPEEWTRKYETMRTYNELLAGGTCIIAMIFALWGLFVFFKSIPLHQIRWKLVFAVAGLSALASFAYAVNELPSSLAGYDPQSSFPGFLATCYAGALGSAVGYGLLMLPLTATAELLYRKRFESNLSFESFLKIQAWGTRELQVGLVAGYGFFGLMAGYQILFYLLGQHVGITSPLGVNSYKVLASTVPAVSALAIGIMASLMEEFLFRIVGLSFLQKFIKNFWVANIVQAAAWAFLHCNYPQQPAYARGLELTVVGIGLGWLLRRFGLWPAVVAHFLFDIFVTVQVLFLAPDAVSQASAYIAVFLLAAIAAPLILQARNDKYQGAGAELLNSAIQPPEPKAKSALEEEEGHAPLTIALLPRAARWSMVTICAIFLLSLFIPSRQIWADHAPVSVDREHAIAYASEYLRKQGYNLDGKQSSAELQDDTARRNNFLQYAYENVGLDETRKLAEKAIFPIVWTVRFFKPLEVEEFGIALDGKGRIAGPAITIAEDAPGARLGKSEAIKIAEKSIEELRPEFGKLAFSSISEVKRKNRTDYTVEFKIPSWKIAEADYIVDATVLGDKLGSYSTGLNLPDKWKFEQARKQPWNEVGGLMSILMGAFIILVLWSTVGLLRERSPVWRVVLMCGLVAGLCALADQLNNLPFTVDQYVTTTPWDNFVISTVTGTTLRVFGQFMSLALIAILATASLHKLVGEKNLRELPRMLFRPNPDNRSHHAQMWMDATIIALTWWVFGKLCTIPVDYLYATAGKMVPYQTFYMTATNANYFCGGLGYFFENLELTLRTLTFLLVLIPVHNKFFKNKVVMAAIIVLYSLLVNSRIHYLSDYMIATGTSIVTYSVMYIGMIKILKNNFAAYIAIAWMTMPLPIVWALIHYALPLYGFDFGCVTLLASLPLIYSTYLWWRQRKSIGVAQPALGYVETK